jgi:hypothetical protein
VPCVSQALADPIGGDIYGSNLAPSAGNFKYFAMTPDGLTIGFEQGQLSFEACDQQQVTIGWPSLQPLLTRDAEQLVSELR